jgi:hypothetical protein
MPAFVSMRRASSDSVRRRQRQKGQVMQVQPHRTSGLLRATSLGARHRGNSLILVTAILVLLVIVATAFISRTQAGRQVSSAQQAATQRDVRADAIREDLARMLGDALFPQPIDPAALGVAGGFRQDPSDPSIRTVTNLVPRLRIEPSARPFSVDRDSNADLVPDFPYNAVTFEVRPWTNWPDFLSNNMPIGPGQPTGAIVGAGGVPIGDANPYGNPGTNDTRWLRSAEPVRFDSNLDGVPDTFSHWAHLSWIGTPNNGYRVVRDIRNIVANTLTNANESNLSLPMALGMPYEQWLPNFPPAGVSNAAAFRTARDQWFAAPSQAASYLTNYASGSALPNFFRLAELPADLRAAVGETFTDTDGDGFTDAFWFLAPQSIDRSLRYLVAVSIVDNSALVNLNTGTRFNRRTTFGAGPSDLALVGDPGQVGLELGFFDNPAHSYAGIGQVPTLFQTADTSPGLYQPVAIGWTRNRFGDEATDSLTFLQAIGMKDAAGNPNPGVLDPSFPANERGEFYSARERLTYFKSSALRGDLPGNALTPFGAPEELELRAYHGANSPWVLSRLERAINTQDNVLGFFRSSPQRAETNEDLQQLNARQLLLDNRRKATTISGARNDRLPTWLWPSVFPDPRIDYNRDGATADTDGVIATIENPAAGDEDFAAWQRQTRRVDLRRAMDAPAAGSTTPPNAAVVEENRREWRADVLGVLERTLTRSWPITGGTFYQSYLGRASNTNTQYQREQYDKTRQMAASYTANIDQWRDGPTLFSAGGTPIAVDPPLHPALAVQDPIEAELRYIGQEKQPFIMEVFFALVYPKSQLNLPPSVPGQTNQYEIPITFLGGGEQFVDSSSKPGVVIAVQIANPYDTPINLFDFRLRIFGRSYSFAAGPLGPAVTLGPATEAGPTTAIVYAINESNTEAPPAGFGMAATWLDFLDIETTELYTPGGDPARHTRIFDASAAWLGGVNVQSPVVNASNPFNDPNGESVELVRVIGPQQGPGAGGNAFVVVDRFDNRVSGTQEKFAEAVARLFTDPQYFPPLQGFEYDPANPPDRNWINGIQIGNNDYFVAWCRGSRAWTWDTWVDGTTDGDGVLRLDESNPRYVFSLAGEPTLPTKVQNGAVGGANQNFRGDAYAFNQNPDGPDLWISYSYRNIFNEERRGKPTFFPCVVREQPGVADNQYGLGFPYPDANGVYPNNVAVGDKGWKQDDWVAAEEFESFRAPLQMTHKDDDIEQVGELLNVFLWGPVIDVGSSIANPTTERTFGEIMLQERDTTDQPAGRGVFVNRLRITPFLAPGLAAGDAIAPTDGPTTVLGVPPVAPYVPSLPAGVGIFDAFVCDDRGARPLDQDNNGAITQAELDNAEFRRLRNAAGFEGRLVPGLVNISTALPETLRALPHMTRLANNDLNFGAGIPNQLSIPFVENPFTRVVDSILRYRDRSLLRVSGTIDPGVAPDTALPYYVDRGLVEDAITGTPGFLGPILEGGVERAQGVRGDRGFASIGELLLLQRTMDESGGAIESWQAKNSFSIEFAGFDPYRPSTSTPGSSPYEVRSGLNHRLATDRINGRTTVSDQIAGSLVVPDRVAGDAEERNLLFAGLSNMVTTRSDVFTVYVRVRAVRQDPVSGIWDGTRRDLIADDSRYVLIVDRSNVEKPGDSPRIIAWQKVESPN